MIAHNFSSIYNWIFNKVTVQIKMNPDEMRYHQMAVFEFIGIKLVLTFRKDIY